MTNRLSKLNGAEVWELLSTFMSHLTNPVITYIRSEIKVQACHQNGPQAFIL